MSNNGFVIICVVCLVGVLPLGAFGEYMEHVYPTKQQCKKLYE